MSVEIVDGNTLVIEFDPDGEEVSGSGKSYILGSSHGFMSFGDIQVSYNIIRRRF